MLAMPRSKFSANFRNHSQYFVCTNQKGRRTRHCAIAQPIRRRSCPDEVADDMEAFIQRRMAAAGSHDALCDKCRMPRITGTR